MKQLIAPIAALSILLASCQHEENNNDETSVHARADSVVGTRMGEINQRAMDDLDKRMAIEVKAKADSIVDVRKNGVHAAAPDTPLMHAGHRGKPLLPAMQRNHDSTKR